MIKRFKKREVVERLEKDLKSRGMNIVENLCTRGRKVKAIETEEEYQKELKNQIVMNELFSDLFDKRKKKGIKNDD